MFGLHPDNSRSELIKIAASVLNDLLKNDASRDYALDILLSAPMPKSTDVTKIKVPWMWWALYPRAYKIINPSHNEIIAAIRSSLSLQIKELAEILRVQRPTVYSWIKNEVEPSQTNRERLQHLYRIALKWKQLCNLPADSLIRSTGADGHSVLELLKADEVDQAAIMNRLEGLATQRRKMKREADEKRPTADALAQSLGLEPDDISDQQEFIDALTGRRSNPE